jgi:hypothetical protein
VLKNLSIGTVKRFDTPFSGTLPKSLRMASHVTHLASGYVGMMMTLPPMRGHKEHSS